MRRIEFLNKKEDGDVEWYTAQFYELSKKATNIKEPISCEVVLGDTSEPEWIERRMKVLNFLKKEKVITSFARIADKAEHLQMIPSDPEIIIDEEGDEIPVPLILDTDYLGMAKCEVVPPKVMEYVQSFLAPKITLLKELDNAYLLFIKVVQKFFVNNWVADSKSNAYYLFLMGKIKEIVEKLNRETNSYAEFHRMFGKLPIYFPFKNLQLAHKKQELGVQQANQKEIMDKMLSHYERIIDFQTYFDVDNADKQNLKEIQNELRKFNLDSFPDDPSKIISKRGTYVQTPRRMKLLIGEELKAEVVADNLVAFSDGSIKYKGKNIQMRAQLKDLCRLFMNYRDRIVTADSIREAIIEASKRNAISNTTIAKYASELHNSLKVHIGRDVIFNQQKEGWMFSLKK